jgi:hypothetical protein
MSNALINGILFIYWDFQFIKKDSPENIKRKIFFKIKKS